MTSHLTDLLPAAGPWLLLAMAAAETAFVTGLAVPAGVATALGAFLASEGHLSLTSVIGAAGVGAAIGDSVGFWLGRLHGRRVLEGEGRMRKLARRHEPRVAALFEGHPIYAVSFARTASFVRTLMPWAAGMSRLSYLRFLVYDLLGVSAWAAVYLTAGYLAGTGWRRVSGILGTGWAVLFAVFGLIGWLVTRHRALRRPSPAPIAADGASAAGSPPSPATADGSPEDRL